MLTGLHFWQSFDDTFHFIFEQFMWPSFIDVGNSAIGVDGKDHRNPSLYALILSFLRVVEMFSDMFLNIFYN